MKPRRPRQNGGAPWVTPGGGINQAGIEQLREILELSALLLECALAGAPTTGTIDRAFENAGVKLGQYRQEVRALAALLRVRPRLVKND